jgi:hypothetical protein
VKIEVMRDLRVHISRVVALGSRVINSGHFEGPQKSHGSTAGYIASELFFLHTSLKA